jgi:hypothetical protein
MLAQWVRTGHYDEAQFAWNDAHPNGTTRMSSDPGYGVVDENCRVHAVDAIFIAGSSVRPMGPLDHSNEFDYSDCSTTQSHEASKFGYALGHEPDVP